MAGQVGFNFQPADAKTGECICRCMRYADLSPEVTLTNGAKFDLDINPFVYTFRL